MKHITKGHEPPSLTQHRLRTHSYFDNYPDKPDLQNSLLAEQGAICCYCMRRISTENMKVAHWASREKYPNKQLDYGNLLGACDGGEGAAHHLSHCDTHQRDTDLTIHPADSLHNCETSIKYQGDGTIYSPDPQVDHDLNETLNLNLQGICVNRAVVVQAAVESLRKKKPAGNWTKAFLQGELNQWANRTGGQFREYCQVVIYYLQKKIATAVP